MTSFKDEHIRLIPYLGIVKFRFHIQGFQNLQEKIFGEKLYISPDNWIISFQYEI